MTPDSTASPAALSRPRFSNGVALRLLASFALLALLPVIAGLTGWTTSHAIHASVTQIAQVTVTFGQYDRRFREHSRRLNAVYSEAMAFESPKRFEASRNIINDALAGMRSSIEALAGNPSIAGGKELLRLLRDAETTIGQTLKSGESRINVSERERQLENEIGALGQAIAKALSQALARTDTAVSGAPQAVELRRRLNALRYEVITLGLLAKDRKQSQPGQVQTPPVSGYGVRLRKAMADLEFLPDLALRRELTMLFQKMSDLALGDGGLFDVQSQVAALRMQEIGERNAARAKVLNIVDALGAMDAANEAKSNELLTAADRALRKADLSFIGVGAACTLLALLVMLVFVKGNVLRRLQGLTEATKRLNSGQLEVQVPDEGDDELSELGTALESFRQNALALRRNERVLQERTQALEYLNRELDQFAYVASHDLKAPMRAIDSLAGFLREDLGKDLGESSVQHLDMMQGRIQRLEALLDSLLEYSRAGRERAPCEVVNLRETIEASVELVSPRGAQVCYSGDFGRVSTWKTPLEQIVRNLADNAFKHSNTEQPFLSVDCEIINKQLRLVISDDGPGIAPEFHERIFGMFQTLKSRDEVEGSGMGLAILKKLIDTYGGAISVASNPAEQRGATFTVYWPIDARLPSIVNPETRSSTFTVLAKAG
ncbi:MAG: ATP-binding protein [Woeseia sp.]